jgi:exosortase/archaeosortase
MIANNIFKAIADFCQNVLFAPYNNIRSMDNWWVQNTASWIFVVIGFVGFFYWLGELKKYQKDENE